MNQMNPVHASRSGVFKSRSNVIIPPITLFQVKPIPSGFPTTICYSLLVLLKYVTFPVHFILLHRVVLIMALKEYVMKAPHASPFFLLIFLTLVLFIFLLLSFLYLILLVVLTPCILLFCFLGSKSD